MADQLSSFSSDEARQRYLEVYDEFVATHWPVPHEELDVPSRFGTTRVRRSGQPTGTPLVLLHPTTGSSLGWAPLIGRLAGDRPVLTPDTIGTAGRSVQTEPVSSIDDLVTWLDDVLDGLDLDGVHLLGYSEGGWIAGAHAALTERPDRLASLTLIEPGGAIEAIPKRTLASLVARGAGTLVARDKRAAVQRFSRWMNGDIELSDGEVDLVLTVFGSFRQRLPTPGRLADDDLRRIAAPTLLLLGAESRILDPDRVADRARALIDGVRVHITPGAGHGLPFQFPDETVDRILAFIRERDTPPTT